MNKRIIILFFALCFLAVSLALVIIYYNAGDTSESAEYPYRTSTQALEEGIAAESAGNLVSGETGDLIVLEQTINERTYVVIKIPYIESGRTKHFVFIGELKERNGKFAFIRRSDDYGLNTTGDVDDGDYTPYNAYLIDDIDGLYFEVGKVFDKEVHPTMNNQKIKLDQDYIFAVFQVGKRPDVKMYREN